MTIIEHAAIPEHIRSIYDLEIRVTLLELAVARLLACHTCCESDRPEDCGDCLCPEQQRWAELERSTESSTLA